MVFIVKSDCIIWIYFLEGVECLLSKFPERNVFFPFEKVGIALVGIQTGSVETSMSSTKNEWQYVTYELNYYSFFKG